MTAIAAVPGRAWRGRADVASLRHKIATRAREGAITGGRAERPRTILDSAVP